MNHIRRYAAILAGLIGTIAAFSTAAPAAFAGQIAPVGAGGPATPGSGVVTVTRTVLMGGMSGWEIALIAIGSALIAAAAAITADRARQRRLAVLPA
jgi:hypothetical protein